VGRSYVHETAMNGAVLVEESSFLRRVTVLEFLVPQPGRCCLPPMDRFPCLCAALIVY
jgi:hypothetical protein